MPRTPSDISVSGQRLAITILILGILLLCSIFVIIHLATDSQDQATTGIFEAVSALAKNALPSGIAAGIAIVVGYFIFLGKGPGRILGVAHFPVAIDRRAGR